MAEHEIVKPQKLADVAAVALKESLVVPALFRREGIDKFRGAEDDTVNVRVEGVLPYRTYGWRNDRSAPIQFDEYSERKIAVTFGGDTYSGVRLTDEQNDMDFTGWSKLVTKQTEAVADGLERGAIAALEGAPYEVTVTLDESNLRKSLIKLRQIVNKLRAPGARRLVVGTDIEAALLEDEKLNLASNVGDAEAVSALREATLGRRYGFDFVVASELADDEGVAMVDSGFIFLNAAPAVPQSVGYGATSSYEGINLTWLRDYDLEYRRDRSVVNTYKGFDYVLDPLIGHDGDGQAFLSEHEHFVRAVKVVLGDALEVEVASGAEGTELTNITGVASEAPEDGDEGDDEGDETP